MSRIVKIGDAPTKIQQEYIDLILAYLDIHGFYPSLSELSKYTGKSIPTSSIYLKYLRKKGYVGKWAALTIDGFRQANKSNVSALREMLQKDVRSKRIDVERSAEDSSLRNK